MEADIIVIGSGIGGLSAALRSAEHGARVLLLTKKDKAESNTNYAQGGIAAVTSQTDDFELHVRDTLEAGDGLCQLAAVEHIVRAGPHAIAELVERGVNFSHLHDGRVSLGKEGGHSKRRILHVGDITGRAIEEALLHAIATHPQIAVREHVSAIDLITANKLRRQGYEVPGQGNRVLGLYALNAESGRVETLAAPVVILATGGCGQVYAYTTNPSIATGDGIAMAYRAGVPVANLEFIQFHPTALYSAAGERFLISEAVRGEGAILRNLAGEAFMGRYHPQADLAPRDTVARAIDREMKAAGSPHVWLDMTGRHSAEELRERFPAIYAALEARGLRLERDLVPVVPAAHYLCGGVVTDLQAATSLPGLYACGEVAHTGLHGANRLASNSLLEAVVMAGGAAESARQYLQKATIGPVSLPMWREGSAQDPDERVVLFHAWEELRRLMWNYVGIVRTTRRLERARARIALLKQEIHEYYWNFRLEPRLLELRNLVQMAELIVECALRRTESRGLHYTLDYPEKLPVAGDTLLRRPDRAG